MVMKWDAGSMPEKKVRFAEFELDLVCFQLYRSGVSRTWNAFLCNFADGSDQKAGSVATARKLPTRFAAIVRPPLESRTARTCRCGNDGILAPQRRRLDSLTGNCFLICP